MEALREALALVFGGARPRASSPPASCADLVLLLLFGLVFLGSVVLSSISTVSAGWLADLLNLPDRRQAPAPRRRWRPCRSRSRASAHGSGHVAPRRPPGAPSVLLVGA